MSRPVVVPEADDRDRPELPQVSLSFGSYAVASSVREKVASTYRGIEFGPLSVLGGQTPQMWMTVTDV